jgi:hypothetical protein
MKIIKFLLLICFFFMVLLTVTSCGESDANDSMLPSKHANESVEDCDIEKTKIRNLTAELADTKLKLTSHAKNLKDLEKSNCLLSLLSILFLTVIGSLIIYILYATRKHTRQLARMDSFFVLNAALKTDSNRGYSSEETIKGGLLPILPKTTPVKNKWLIAAASVIGKSHIQNNLPCQDKHALTDLGAGWGIAISCDGAGSARQSHKGAEFVATNASAVFKHLIETQGWAKQNKLPESNQWRKLSVEALHSVRLSLDNFAKKQETPIGDLACTIIVVIYSPTGLLLTHVGDGRAGYCNRAGEWLPLMVPWKGEEANQTIFLTSSIWQSPEKFIESNVFRDIPVAFTLMSDGCENHSFELGEFDTTKQKFIEKNNPYPKFFNPLVEQLRRSSASGMSDKEIQENWKKFLTNGTPKLIEESDDKTMIIGVFFN